MVDIYSKVSAFPGEFTLAWILDILANKKENPNKVYFREAKNDILSKAVAALRHWPQRDLK